MGDARYDTRADSAATNDTSPPRARGSANTMRRRVDNAELSESLLGEETPQPPPPTRQKSLQPWVSEAVGSAVTSLCIVIINLASSRRLSPAYVYGAALSEGVIFFLLSNALASAVMLLRSPLPLVLAIDGFFAALFSNMAADIAAKRPAGELGTLAVAMALTKFLIGGSEWLLGRLAVGKAVQFMPAPVMSGFLASIGFVQLDSCCKMVTGCALTTPSLCR